MLEAMMKDLREGAGIERIADLGVVHEGQVGLQHCSVALRIERWQDAYFLCIATVLSDGPGFRRTRIVKWPYSRRDRRDLAAALVDLHVVAAGPRAGIFVDERGGAGRLLDSLMRRRVHGSYRFRSPVSAAPAIEVSAEVVDLCGRRTVTLTESTPGKGYIAAHLPHAAFSGLCAALGRFVAVV